MLKRYATIRRPLGIYAIAKLDKVAQAGERRIRHRSVRSLRGSILGRALGESHPRQRKRRLPRSTQSNFHKTDLHCFRPCRSIIGESATREHRKDVSSAQSIVRFSSKNTLRRATSECRSRQVGSLSVRFRNDGLDRITSHRGRSASERKVASGSARRATRTSLIKTITSVSCSALASMSTWPD